MGDTHRGTSGDTTPRNRPIAPKEGDSAESRKAESEGKGGGEGEEEMVHVLVAALADKKQVTVKLKVGNEDFSPESDREWTCHTCNRRNLPSKRRCGSCQSWKGGTRKNILGARKLKSTPPKEGESVPSPQQEKRTEGDAHTQEKSKPDDKNENYDGPSEEDDDEEPEISMGARLPKRKRTNLYASLSPAVIQATTKAKAEAYAAAPPSPQLASKSSKRQRNSSFDRRDGSNSVAHPAALAVETAVSDAGGKIPNEFIGQDGNLFYCRICLGLGEVVCCDGCPHVFHQSCLPVGPSKASLENDDDPWYCHECVQAGRAVRRANISPQKKRRKVKERCSECGKKETKAHPCVPCSARDCGEFFHLNCPSQGEGGEIKLSQDVSSSTQRLLCSSCEAAKVVCEKRGRTFAIDQRKLDEISMAQGRLLSPLGRTGRGFRGRGGRGGKGGKGSPNFRRMSSSEERMKRFKGLEQSQGLSTNQRGRKRISSSGFQPPYSDDAEDDEEVGPQSLTCVEQPTSSTPAFFFFLLHNRAALEKSLSRKNPYFRGMTRGPTRNEKVAQEGAAIWIEMTQKERNEWVEVSMKDFEQRTVAWKEKEIIEAMIKSTDDINQDKQGGGEDGGVDEVSSQLLKDELYVSNTRARLNQLSNVKSHPVKVSVKESGNSILLELLNDARFRPLPLINTTRAKEDLLQNIGRVNQAVHQFNVQGPIETSLGDDCMGCTRGWNHFCCVLNRPVPASDHRAKLQPPCSSLSATRIGLGLRVNLPREQPSRSSAQGLRAAKLCQRTSYALAEVCPNYRVRDGCTLWGPSLRLDDTTMFIESATALKSTTLGSNGSAPECNFEADNSSPGKSKVLTRGLLPMRGRKRKSSPEDSGNSELDTPGGASLLETGKEERALQYRCGQCRIIQTNPVGCMSCRKSQLLSQMAKRSFCSPDSVDDEVLTKSSLVANSPTYGDGYAKQFCFMLGRTSLADVSVSGRKNHADGGPDKVGLSLTQPWWSPNVIMPPIPKRLPTPKHAHPAPREMSENSSDESTSSENPKPKSGHHVDEKTSWECAKCQHINDISLSKCGSCQASKRGSTKNSRHRSCTSKAGELEPSEDRNALALKHKEDTDKLARKCLIIACCGILSGMIRRDPLRLFAEPVPDDVKEYHQEIHDPIDFATMRRKILSAEYSSLGAFIADARRLCINACVFNAADSLYAMTAKTIYDSLEVMHDRAKNWISMLKSSYTAAFRTSDSKGDSETDVFKDVKEVWPGAVELLEDSEWLEKMAQSDFVRTRENEVAYFGSLAIQRASAAAKASLAHTLDMGGAKQPVVKRSHHEDDMLRNIIDAEVAQHVGPVQLRDINDPRELQLFKLLKKVQKRRTEARLLSESGCARCDGITADETDKAVSLLRSKFKRAVDATRSRVHLSRLSQSTGLASRNARKKTAATSIERDTPLEMIGQVDTESMVSVRGSRVHGWGLFADQNFSKGEVLAEYIGEYVNNAVADMREKSYRDQRIQDYQFRVDGSLVSVVLGHAVDPLGSASTTHVFPLSLECSKVIDATLRGGYARYINHSCSPNCVAKVIEGKPPNEHLKRVLIISQRDIKASEELSYDYQFPLEMNLDLRIPCNCGSRQCRGFMNWDTPEKSIRRNTKSGISGRK